MKKHFYLMAMIFIMASCSVRNLVYLSDLPPNAYNVETITNMAEPKIQPIDILGITVSTLNPESNLLFNSGVITSVGSAGAMANTPSQFNEGYRVDKFGFINFPILGKVEVGGLTLEEVTDKLTGLLEKEAKNPIVNVKLLNFRVTVVGEVNRPNTFPVPTERINIVEALGLAGDLTPFGKRENILLIREIDGIRTTVRMDINQTAILSSPYYYLQQNDIIYVEPVKARAAQASLGRENLTLALSLISIFAIVMTRFL